MKLPNTKIVIYTLFVVAHILFFNVNTAEWGDSYRILRASDYIREGDYPIDEKRPPLFSALLALRPVSVDQVVWGRLFMFGVSLAVLFIFEKFVSVYIQNTKYQHIALLFYVLNPVIFYWSIRIMADVFFLGLILLTFYILKKHKENFAIKHAILLGLTCGLGILTRFEGYVLLGSIGIGILYFKKDLAEKIKYLLSFGLTALIVVLPYLLYRNPLVSSYLSEPSDRAFNLNTVWIYVISLLFVFGFIPAFYFIFKYLRTHLKFFKENIAFTTFFFLGLFLILLWPAAIPRLFTSVIPFLIVIVVLGLKKFVENSQKLVVTDYIGMGLLFIIVAVSQYTLRLQFVVPKMYLLAAVLAIQAVSIYFLFIKKNLTGFIAAAVIGMGVVTIFTVRLHRNVFIAVKEAAVYASQNLEGKIGYNDVSSVSGWYLGDSGVRYDIEVRSLLSYQEVLANKLDYLLITNEHNPDMELDFSRRPHLEEIKEFRYNINGTEFYTKILKFNKDYTK